MSGGVLKTCANQLEDVITDSFLTSLLQETVPTCFRRATTAPRCKKKNIVFGQNDYRTVGLTSILIKCFEKLVLQHINNNIPARTLTSLKVEPKGPQKMPSSLSPHKHLRQHVCIGMLWDFLTYPWHSNVKKYFFFILSCFHGLLIIYTFMLFHI